MKHNCKIITFTAMVWVTTGISRCTSIAHNRSVKSTSTYNQVGKKQIVSLSKKGIKAIKKGDIRQVKEIFDRYHSKDDKKSIANTEIKLWQDVNDSVYYVQESILYFAIFCRNKAKENDKNKYLEVIAFLLEKGANPNLPRKRVAFNLMDNYPLSIATKVCDVDVVKLLLKYKANINNLDHGLQPNSFTGGALHMAIRNGYIPILKILLAHKDIDVNLLARTGLLPLQNGIIGYEFRRDSNQLNVVRLLLRDKRTDVNKKDGTFEKDASLGLAVEWGLTDMVEILLEHPAIDLEPKNRHGRTPLAEAVHNGHVEIVALLLNHGANPEGTTLTKWGAFLSKLGSQKHKKIKELLEKARKNQDKTKKFET
ncbi:ankyrin repeat domain-containing protein [Cardinium endosymbiont of Culicoides punctatus]|uniref:ankyrin repeat domain-containing protein n=1 Tax=Cardinium endosymbiont of Culicoides punctatus TaxID=2304601 RepID=UPI001058CF4E|nr:ankyrin repeat domain-containing protein [Cardinium endosymbiont of Culicoides punctatus]TDG94666.1 hypothetical protein CCPUN_07620 [Cardinium endosymbiont of Culicoides punctatus]